MSLFPFEQRIYDLFVKGVERADICKSLKIKRSHLRRVLHTFKKRTGMNLNQIIIQHTLNNAHGGQQNA